MANYFQRVMHPDWYHGHGKKAPYFEGWYFKVVNKTEDAAYAFIPGVFIHQDSAKTHSFIQVLDGTTGKTSYHTYGNFEAAKDKFDVRVGVSYFNASRILLNIADDSVQIKGELHFEGLKPWPVSWRSPGIMGWYGWLPGMECNHGVVSLDHTISGVLDINGKTMDFTGGRGYIEKDWGEAFPTGHVWMQSNHFDTPETSLTASIATIPHAGLIRRPFAGFIVGLLHKDVLHRFATYNNSKVDKLVVTDSTVEWVIYNRKYELSITAIRAEGGLLKAPQRTDMHKRVEETLKATINVELVELDNTRRHRIFHGQGRNAGLEVVGDLSLLLKS